MRMQRPGWLLYPQEDHNSDIRGNAEPWWSRQVDDIPYFTPGIQPRRRVYLAGPITGYPVSERVATFRNKKAMLERAGFEVVNPCEISPPGVDWSASLREDIKHLMTCDTIYLLRGWEKSKGVQLELFNALTLGFEVMVESENE